MTEPTNPKGKPRGRKGGRPPSPIPHKRINIYLSLTELAALHAIHKSPSQAIRQLIKEKQK
jgi:hypothetical protein